MKTLHPNVSLVGCGYMLMLEMICIFAVELTESLELFALTGAEKLTGPFRPL